MGIYGRGFKGKCDKLFSQRVRSLGYCEKCGKTEPGVQLQTAHIISRRYSATRCDLENAYCLCAGCHRFYTLWPREFSHFITEHTGSAKYDELKLKAEQVTKVNWEDKYKELKESEHE